ncbi:MAG: DeoR/GlpR family DNA-binding transcription regulator [Longicatena sp.]
MIDRHTKILEYLTENKKVEVTKISEILNVSQVTIRKDLDQLENLGLVKREHGFAKLNSSDDLNSRLAYHYDVKLKIAEQARELVEDGETIMIESGSCCALVASEIATSKKDVTIITNSAFIADYVRKLPDTKIVLLGGDYQNESQVMVGPITRRCAETFFVDKLFIGTDGYSEKAGFTGNDYMRAETVRDMAKQAENVVVVTESTKFHHKGVVSLLPTSQISMLITDREIPLEIEERFIQQNIKVLKVAE